jgi:putative oxidoreductase
MDIVVLIARIVFAVVFIVSGLAHFMATDAMAGYAASRRLPSPRLSVLLSGGIMVLGALMVVLGLWGDLGALLVAVTVLAIAFLMHPFWNEREPQNQMMERTQFLKDFSLGGGALGMFALFALVPDLGLTITDPLFDVM